jgi:hypothetical protein
LPLSSGARWGGRTSWQPAGLVEDEDLADGMMRLLSERSPRVDVSVVPLSGLAAKVGSEEAERILERLRNPTTAATALSRKLEREAAERLKGTEPEWSLLVERRSGVDRRLGDRRKAVAVDHAAQAIRSVERREAVERRSGVERREQQPLSLA